MKIEELIAHYKIKRDAYFEKNNCIAEAMQHLRRGGIVFPEKIESIKNSINHNLTVSDMYSEIVRDLEKLAENHKLEIENALA